MSDMFDRVARQERALKTRRRITDRYLNGDEQVAEDLLNALPYSAIPDWWDVEQVLRVLSLAGLLADSKRDAAVVGPYRDLLREFVDDDPCEFDHHGGCQTHGFYEPSPGERCPNALAKELLEDAPPTGRTDPMDPVKALQDLDEHLRQHKRQWNDDEALTDDYWTGFEDARRIVGDHLAASRQRRGW